MALADEAFGPGSGPLLWYMSLPNSIFGAALRRFAAGAEGGGVSTGSLDGASGLKSARKTGLLTYANLQYDDIVQVFIFFL